MQKNLLLIFLLAAGLFLASPEAESQCSVCKKTAQQLGEKPAKGLNSGILYLAFMPVAIAGYIGFRWWQSHRRTGAG